jgi:hypothetical protein
MKLIIEVPFGYGALGAARELFAFLAKLEAILFKMITSNSSENTKFLDILCIFVDF